MQLSEILTEVKNETRNAALDLTTLVPVLNALQSQYIQPKARVHLAPATLSVVANTASYTLASVSASIYVVRFLTEVKAGKEYRLDDLLPEDDVERDGIRIWDDTFIFQPTPTAARTLKVYAWKKLTAFTTGGTTMVPDIPADFHDLYVQGAAHRLKRRKDDLNLEGQDFWRTFLNRLDALEMHQDRRRQAPARRKLKARPWI